jgi:hypothetical protein
MSSRFCRLPGLRRCPELSYLRAFASRKLPKRAPFGIGRSGALEGAPLRKDPFFSQASGWYRYRLLPLCLFGTSRS